MDKKQQKKLITEIMHADEKDGLYGKTRQTAVEWFDEQIQEYVIASDHIARNLIIQISFEDYMELQYQAKAMEKEQIINAWRNGDNDSMYSPKELDQQAEQYYNEIYMKK